MTYPVFKGDTMVELYQRLIQIPAFVLGSLKLLESIPSLMIVMNMNQESTKEGNIDETDLDTYKNLYQQLTKYITYENRN